MPKTYKILIVDDRSLDRHLMRKMLALEREITERKRAEEKRKNSKPNSARRRRWRPSAPQ